MRFKLFALIGLAMLSFGFQAPEGPADRCDNYHSTAPAHRCACAKTTTECKMPGMRIEPDAKCKTYCKPEHCHCLTKCTS
jgi:hypothetical protein